jgi:hypothetical protein
MDIQINRTRVNPSINEIIYRAMFSGARTSLIERWHGVWYNQVTANFGKGDVT